MEGEQQQQQQLDEGGTCLIAAAPCCGMPATSVSDVADAGGSSCGPVAGGGVCSAGPLRALQSKLYDTMPQSAMQDEPPPTASSQETAAAGGGAAAALQLAGCIPDALEESHTDTSHASVTLAAVPDGNTATGAPPASQLRPSVAPAVAVQQDEPPRPSLSFEQRPSGGAALDVSALVGRRVLLAEDNLINQTGANMCVCQHVCVCV
jgi:hypothetical protein